MAKALLTKSGKVIVRLSKEVDKSWDSYAVQEFVSNATNWDEANAYRSLVSYGKGSSPKREGDDATLKAAQHYLDPNEDSFMCTRYARYEYPVLKHFKTGEEVHTKGTDGDPYSAITGRNCGYHDMSNIKYCSEQYPWYVASKEIEFKPFEYKVSTPFYISNKKIAFARESSVSIDDGEHVSVSVDTEHGGSGFARLAKLEIKL